jgi:hypothetical protein
MVIAKRIRQRKELQMLTVKTDIAVMDYGVFSVDEELERIVNQTPKSVIRYSAKTVSEGNTYTEVSSHALRSALVKMKQLGAKEFRLVAINGNIQLVSEDGQSAWVHEFSYSRQNNIAVIPVGMKFAPLFYLGGNDQ